MIILIPAYEPDEKLVRLVTSIRAADPHQEIVVVDDGSGEEYAPVFAAVRDLGGDVIGHSLNLGKGAALKRGFAHVTERYAGHDVVCADCDGQHGVVDILRVAAALREHRAGIMLGARQFVGDVPRRSRFGNDVTRGVFRLATGLRLQDTQIGLRGYPAWMLGWLRTIDGDRFEYELEVLLAAKRAGFQLNEVPIATIYLDGNESSHFRTVRDSVRVYVPFVKFCLSSLTAFAIDAALFFTLAAMTGSLLVSVVGARLVSATFNFVSNRVAVFRGSRGRPLATAARYAALVGALMAANFALLRALTSDAGLGVVPAKLLTEISLFVMSYQLQRRVVFGRTIGRKNDREGGPLPATAPAVLVAAPDSQDSPGLRAGGSEVGAVR